MTRRIYWLLALLAVPVVAVACGGGSTMNAGAGAGTTHPDGGTATSATGGGTTSGTTTGPSGDNTAPMIVDNGPPGGGGSADVPYVSVTVCVPGTSTCQTIDHIIVDTGSSGLRIIASALHSTVALPLKSASAGASLAECFEFDDGYTWGSVRLADVKMGGELASNIPLQLVGDPMFSAVPSDCSSTGSSEGTVGDLGGNGLIGINQIVPDCGTYCADTNPVQPGGYYACTGTSCTATAVPEASQIANPIASFATDNNGAVLQFGTVPASGAKTLAGSLIFGIGTQTNNGLGSAAVLTVDQYGNFTTTFNGKTLKTSFIDSGTNTFAFNDAAITQCSDAPEFYCPASTLSLTATNIGVNKVSSMVSFSIANTDTLFNSTGTAFDDLGTTGIDNDTFDWGFPFFIGRSVFIALQGATTPGGAGPYVAY